MKSFVGFWTWRPGGFRQRNAPPEVIKEVADEIATFSELHAEFVLLLARTVKVDPEELRQCSPFGLSFQIVLRALGYCGSPDEEQAAEGQAEPV